MIKSVTDVFDYPTLKKLAAVLWRQDNSYHGAAVMVGAGFSRCAATTGDINKKLPLWNDLSNSIVQEMGGSSSDPLRLAEEYSAYFGKQALYDLVKNNINDAAWQPGELHSTLLELPWSEVLTTNWDTLLERASLEVHQPVYNLVAKQEDLSSARSPRIVKLHGTVNVTEDLIFTQEDYRKYPQRHAAFVNFARQVFIENEFCLLGFSGDDPNFLQWAGWVRDQLATNARRIYLVGALNLTAAKRKYLESINVAPIDLADLVADYDDHDTRHSLATKIFLETLKKLRPKKSWEWSLTQIHEVGIPSEDLDNVYRDFDSAAKVHQQRLTYLRSDRIAYPGWIACPSTLRWELQTQVNHPFLTLGSLASMEVVAKTKLLYEIGWRHAITYEILPPWLAKEMLAICDPADGKVPSKKEQMELVSILLRNTRWLAASDAQPIADATTKILNSGERYWQESLDEVAYHQAIVARDQFDYQTMEKFVNKIVPNSSSWKLRKAALLAELGRFDDGETLISEAYRELRSQYRNDPSSVYILSRLAWAHWLIRGVSTFRSQEEYAEHPSAYQSLKCDPWDQIDDIQRRITKSLQQQQKHQGIEPLFEPGSYRDNSSSVTYSSEIHPYLLLDGIANSVGIPLRWHAMNFLVEHASKLVELDDIDELHRFALAIRAASNETSDVLKRVFSRMRVASLSQAGADFLLSRCVQAIEYWGGKWSHGKGETRTYAIERLRVFVEVLARVTVRATPEQAKEIFRLVCRLTKQSEFQHFWLSESLKHLTDYALMSIPASQHEELLFDALSFPLQSEIGSGSHHSWPNPIIRHPGIRSHDAGLDRRLDEIIDRIRPVSADSACALSRLLPLVRSGFLAEAERRKIADKIWGEEPDYQVLPEIGLLKYVLLILPSQHPDAMRVVVRDYLFNATGKELSNTVVLREIAGAAQDEALQELPSATQAALYFEKMVQWREADNEGASFLRLVGQPDKRIGELIGKVLAQSVVPAMDASMLTEENFLKLVHFYGQVQGPEVLVALPYFAVTDAKLSDRVERILRQALQEREADKVAFSSLALLKWSELAKSAATTRLSARLIYIIGSSRLTGLSSLLWAANKMYEKELLSAGDAESLAEILPVIFDNADYRRVSTLSRDAISISLVRAECVRLAKSLLHKITDESEELHRLLDEARNDSLPEVRFAGET